MENRDNSFGYEGFCDVGKIYEKGPANKPVSILMMDQDCDGEQPTFMELTNVTFENQPFIKNNFLMDDAKENSIDYHRLDQDIEVSINLVSDTTVSSSIDEMGLSSQKLKGRKPGIRQTSNVSSRKNGKKTRLQRREERKKLQEKPESYPKTKKNFPLIDAQNNYFPSNIADISRIPTFSFDDVPHNIPIFSLTYPHDTRLFRTRQQYASGLWSSTPPNYDPPPSTITVIPIIYEALLRFMINVRSPTISLLTAVESSESLCFSFKKANSQFDPSCILLDESREIIGLDHTVQNKKGKMLCRQGLFNKDPLLFVGTQCPEGDSPLAPTMVDEMYQLVLDLKRDLMKKPIVLKMIEYQKHQLPENFIPRPFDIKMNPDLECTCGYYASSPKDFKIHFDSNCEISPACKDKKKTRQRKTKVCDTTTTTASTVPSLRCNHSSCGLEFGTYYELTMHKKTHVAKGGFVCEKKGCGRSYKNLSDLRRHAKLHTAVICTCEICGKSFNNAERLRSHKRIHKTTLFVCPEPGCSKSYKKKEHLKQHLDFHRGVVYVCKEQGCGRQYKSRASMYKHEDTHKNKTWPCTHASCDKVFQTAAGRKKHEKAKHVINGISQ